MLPVGFEPLSQRVGSLGLAAAEGEKLYYDYITGKADDLGKDEGINTQGVERNLMVVNSWGFNVTPMLFYRNADGKVKIIRGSPKDIDMILKDISG